MSQTGALFGFVEIEEICSTRAQGHRGGTPEERLQIEFAGVKKTYLPMHYVLRIDEVERKQGVSKITSVEAATSRSSRCRCTRPARRGGPHER
jgi:hypothetical protein